ncbi:MAG: low affinity iron permease family protein [Caulobacter sp.]|nr:low affinity iron permease family protein [Caulobacter sp.]
MDRFFARFANATARVAGSPGIFILCLLLVVGWAASGPIFQFSETWQLVINTGTTIITFLMVFLIQNTQNRDSAAVQTKLDELILTSEAENDFMGIEKLTEKELAAMHARCVERARRAHERLDKVSAERDARRDRAAEKRDKARKVQKAKKG